MKYRSYPSFFALILFGLMNQAIALTPSYWKTTQQVPVLFYQTTAAPLATMHVAFRAGSGYDEPHKFGLAALTASMLDQGSAGLSAANLAENLADSGAIYAEAVNRDMADFSLTTLTEPKAFELAVKQFALILAKPDFPARALVQQKHQQLASLLNENESPDATAMNVFFEALYQHHPYAHRILGSKETLNRINIKDLIDFYHRYYVLENAMIVIVGNMSRHEAEKLSDTLVSGLKHGKPAESMPSAKPLSQAIRKTQLFPSSQTAIYLGQLGISHDSPDYFPLTVGNYILGGGGLTSLLATDVREKNGLTYSILSQFQPMPGKGPFFISLSTENTQAAQAAALTRDILSAFVKNGPTEEELRSAKRYLVGSFPLALSSNTDIANVLLRMLFYKMPLDYLETYTTHINNISAVDVQQAFQKTIHLDKLLEVSVGQNGA